MNEDELGRYLAQFDPYRNRSGRISEQPDQYAQRMQESFLPHWPKEVLIEWLYQHAGACLADYAPLRFETFRFSLETWRKEEVPGAEAFADPRFCENFSDIERRANGPYGGDWLARHMLEKGTWNTPILLLDNRDNAATGKSWCPVRSPWHLLEGHRRLSFFNALRQLGKAAPEHAVYVVTLLSA